MFKRAIVCFGLLASTAVLAETTTIKCQDVSPTAYPEYRVELTSLEGAPDKFAGFAQVQLSTGDTLRREVLATETQGSMEGTVEYVGKGFNLKVRTGDDTLANAEFKGRIYNQRVVVSMHCE